MSAGPNQHIDADELTDEWADRIVRLPRSKRVEALFGFEPVEPYQRDLLDNPSQKKVVGWGRRSGKTETCGAIGAEAALRLAGEDVAIYAPYAETAKEMFRVAVAHLESMGMHGVVGVETDNKITWELANGTRLIARTLGSEAQRGKGPKVILIDEAALVAKETITRVVRPMTITHSDYELILTSTPKGKRGYFWEKWNDSGWWQSHVTCWENPYAQEDILEEIKAEEDALTWQQEYLAEFIEHGNAYLPSDLVAACMPGRHDNLAPEEIPTVERQGSRVWLAVDPATGGKDRAVYTSIDEYGNVFDVLSYDEQKTTNIVGTIRALHEEHNYRAALVEKNAIGEGVVDFGELTLPVRPFTSTSKSKASLYKTLRRYLEDGELTLPNHERLYIESTSLVFDHTSGGILRVQHPPGGHDDFPDSLALAVWAWHNDLGGPVEQRHSEKRTEATRTSRRGSRGSRSNRNSASRSHARSRPNRSSSRRDSSRSRSSDARRRSR
jgi:hypothetical protein